MPSGTKSFKIAIFKKRALQTWIVVIFAAIVKVDFQGVDLYGRGGRSDGLKLAIDIKPLIVGWWYMDYRMDSILVMRLSGQEPWFVRWWNEPRRGAKPAIDKSNFFSLFSVFGDIYAGLVKRVGWRGWCNDEMMKRCNDVTMKWLGEVICK
jgi:hypothetical protein